MLISLNPFVRLEWVAPETLYAQTAFVRFYRTEPLPTFKYTRWHALHLSPQAAVLGLIIRRARAPARLSCRNLKGISKPPQRHRDAEG